METGIAILIGIIIGVTLSLILAIVWYKINKTLGAALSNRIKEITCDECGKPLTMEERKLGTCEDCLCPE